MKRLMALSTICFLLINVVGCGNKGTTKINCEGFEALDNTTDVSVGLVTDSGSIDDKSFNEGTWNGIKCYENINNSKSTYQQPTGEAVTDYLSSINNLVDTGVQLVITPGFKFEEAIYEAQTKYPDVKFILLDGTPTKKGESIIANNVLSIYFAEEQAGFLAGIAAALNSKSHKLAFVGGMEIPAVQRFGYGFTAGVAYANETYNTNADIVDFDYAASFSDVQVGQTLAAAIYDKGVDVIFHAAAGVGLGIFNEAKTRAENGNLVYVIGVDVDQYEQGIYGDGSKSVTLTSAIKRIDVAAYDYIGKFAQNKFPGGQTITLDLTNDGVGLPTNNPNLDSDTKSKIEETTKIIIDGTIKVPKSMDELKQFLKNYNFTPTASKLK